MCCDFHALFPVYILTVKCEYKLFYKCYTLLSTYLASKLQRLAISINIGTYSWHNLVHTLVLLVAADGSRSQ